jgi:hypothetical protein
VLLSYKRKSGDDFPQGFATDLRLDADGHELVVVRGVRLTDRHMGDPSMPETSFEVKQFLLGTRFKGDGVSVRRKTTRGAFPGGVNRLGDLDPSREVATDDHVVVQTKRGLFRTSHLGRWTLLNSPRGTFDLRRDAAAVNLRWS